MNPTPAEAAGQLGAVNRRLPERRFPWVVARRLSPLLPVFVCFLSLILAAVAFGREPVPASGSAPGFPQAEHEVPVRLLPDGAYFDTLLRFIGNARDRVRIGMFLFKTTSSPRNLPSRIVEELAAAQRRGLRVSVILEHSGYDEDLNIENRRVADRLRKAGVEVLFDSPGVTSHEKVAVIDGRYSFVGSHNFTHSALARNRELSVLIDDPGIAAELELFLDSLAGN